MFWLLPDRRSQFLCLNCLAIVFKRLLIEQGQPVFTQVHQRSPEMQPTPHPHWFLQRSDTIVKWFFMVPRSSKNQMTSENHVQQTSGCPPGPFCPQGMSVDVVEWFFVVTVVERCYWCFIALWHDALKQNETDPAIKAGGKLNMEGSEFIDGICLDVAL